MAAVLSQVTLATVLMVRAAAADPAAMLEKILAGAAMPADFSVAFLDAVPMATIVELVTQIEGVMGPVARVTVDGQDAVVTSASHRMDAQISLNAEGQVQGLFFRPPEPLSMRPKDAEAEMAALGDRVAWLAIRNGETLSARDADAPLAVGSAFKIGVLSVLVEEVTAGRRSWSDVIRLEDRHRSHPSGVMQDWPVGGPVTLHTAALQMIAISDNTATDLLIDTLGRRAIADRLGLGHLLTTREFFALKVGGGADYIAAHAEEKAVIAARAASTLSDLVAVPHYLPGLEWEIALTKLCALIAPLAELDVMQINPGVLAPGTWGPVAYKGGSEPGVLAFVSMVDTATGPLCLALAVNHSAEVDLIAASAAYRGFARSVAQPK